MEWKCWLPGRSPVCQTLLIILFNLPAGDFVGRLRIVVLYPGICETRIPCSHGTVPSAARLWPSKGPGWQWLSLARRARQIAVLRMARSMEGYRPHKRAHSRSTTCRQEWVDRSRHRRSAEPRSCPMLYGQRILRRAVHGAGRRSAHQR